MINFGLIIFTRIPISGETKTRLTLQEGGPLTANEAARFYEASLTDVIATSLNAIQSCRENNPDLTYDMFIAYEPKDREEDIIQILKKLHLADEALNQIKLFSTGGENFNDRINMAFDTVIKDGYEAIVIIGGDHPTIQPYVIQEAFLHLELLNNKFGKGAMVVGPCLEAGVYLVGQTSKLHIDFDGVFFNPHGITALEAFTEKAIERNIPLAMLELVPDVDIPSDLASLIVTLKTMEYSAKFQSNITLPQYTLNVMPDLHLVTRAPPSQRDLKPK